MIGYLATTSVINYHLSSSQIVCRYCPIFKWLLYVSTTVVITQ